MKQVKISALVYFQNYTCYESIKEVGACGFGTADETIDNRFTTGAYWERIVVNFAMRWIAFLSVIGIGLVNAAILTLSSTGIFYELYMILFLSYVREAALGMIRCILRREKK
ncbi:hypothetical protein WR25_04285 [Diploscapter pachys]|uniref:Uncharacterized protein n=1 Tax=Diploscapter pachys TaxID=2018661 RepID=A0A2A2KJL3_9BILA|nr:hypothetical protein WR25_04285 [Diploscapter pachys]